jgi:hypothetical protein
MRLTTIAGGSIVAAALCWAALSAAQTQPIPGPGTGIVPVTGTVTIEQMPAVSALQEGPWQVSVINAPEVRIANRPVISLAPTEFLRKGGRYAVTWSTGERETVTVAESGAGGWVRVDTTDRQRWINVGAARSIEDAP